MLEFLLWSAYADFYATKGLVTLTIHVQFDRGRDWNRDVVVGRLAGEDGVQVAAFQILDD